jgi:YD repeat-containing protein
MNVAAILDREASYAYDKNGNVTEVGTTTFYTYDFDNRLTQSNIWNGTATTTTTYAYDPFGNRISQSASTTTTLYPSKYYSITTTTSGTSTVATSTDYLYSGATFLARLIRKWSMAPRPEPRLRGTITPTTSARRMSRQTPPETWRNGSITRRMGVSSQSKTLERLLRHGDTLGNFWIPEQI